jgi:hypothetical protein
VAFCFPAKQTLEVCLSGFAQRRTLSLQLTGLRPKPERLPMQLRPRQQRLRPKQPSHPKQQHRSQQQQRPKQQQPNPKQRQQPVPQRQQRR